LCADGYEGRIIDSEDKKEVTYGGYYGSVVAANCGNDNATIVKSYYTCCSKSHDKGIAINRHCSDPMRIQPVPKNNNCDGKENNGGNFTHTNIINIDGANNKQIYPR
jgi:hypothetical protein